jgi:hypothetical protein
MSEIFKFLNISDVKITKAVCLGRREQKKQDKHRLDNQLIFSDHSSKPASKANQILGMLRRSFTFLDETLLMQLFN